MKQKNALISVFNKNGIEPFAQELKNMGWNIYSSGGTAQRLNDAGIITTDVATLVGGSAILGHKVVTLSREIHAGLLADYNDTADMAEMERLGIPLIDLVCVDCYPLEQELQNPNCTLQSIREKTDIGGPAMLRSGAKGGRIVACQVEQRTSIIQWLKDGMPNEEKFRLKLAAIAESYVRYYASLSIQGLEKFL